jgi:sporulation protein YlmC with PRC-barrel domain
MKMQSTALTLILSAAMAVPAAAQTIDTDVIALTEWDYDDVYAEGMSAEEFIDDMEVFSRNGENIGDVEDIIANQDGKLIAVIAEVGGFWDIGDTHVSVPWSEIEMSPDGITVPVTEETIEDYGLFDREYLSAETASSEMVGEVDAADTGPSAFRLSELIGDYARLRGDGDEMVNYGYVRDVMIQDGSIAAVVVNPDVGYGAPGYYTAYPYYGYAYRPGGRYYDMPYTEGDVAEMEEFDYERIELM